MYFSNAFRRDFRSQPKFLDIRNTIKSVDKDQTACATAVQHPTPLTRNNTRHSTRTDTLNNNSTTTNHSRHTPNRPNLVRTYKCIMQSLKYFCHSNS